MGLNPKLEIGVNFINLSLYSFHTMEEQFSPEVMQKLAQDPRMRKMMMKKLQDMKQKAAEQRLKEVRESKKGDKKSYKMAAEFLAKRDVRILKMYTDRIVGKFGKYIKSVWVVGSMKTGRGKKKTSDIDVPVIVDDTDVKRMTRSELKEKLFQRMVEMGYQIDKRIHPQAYLLTEFWQYVREGNPVLMTMIRDGAIIYDTGFLLPIKMLLLKGMIKPSKEAIDKLIITSNELLDVTEKVILQKLTHNLHLAAVSSSQAVLMELGYRPTTPKETPKFVREILFEKFGYITEEDVNACDHLVMTYKKVEHKELNEISGEEIEKMLKSAKDYVKKMRELLINLRKEKGDSYLFELFEKKEELEMKRDGMITPDEEKPVERREEQIKKELGQV